MSCADTTKPSTDRKIIRAAFKLPPLLCEVLGALIDLPLVTADDVKPVKAKSSKKTPLKVTICRLRKMIEPYGINIYSGTAVGYWLEPADRDKALAQIASVIPNS